MFQDQQVSKAIQDFMITRARDSNIGIARNTGQFITEYPQLIQVVAPSDTEFR